MNRFLKKEWEDATVSEEERWRARNRAWSRFHSKPAPNLLRRGVVAAVGVGGLILLWTLIPTSPVAPSFEATPAPPPQADDAATVSIQPVERSPDPPAPPRLATPRKTRQRPRLVAKTAPSAEAADTSPTESTRLVLNFRLPESGVRMIWVQDPDFYRHEGESQ